MNRTFRFVMAGVLALLVVAAAGGVWASTVRQGTVIVPPSNAVVGNAPEKVSCVKVDMIKVTFTVFSPDEQIYVCSATNVTTPAPEEYGPAPKDTAFYSDVFKFVATQGGVEVANIPTEVCYAYPPEYEKKEAKIHIWDADAKEWKIIPGDGAAVPDGGLAAGDPRQLCAKSQTTGIFSLIGNP